ncbi:unnamed protein product [Nyctereutes procyonoides]|uniref:(raccoon dog) hypothetical protein n=1 Tax=Nyctereutes procyonoides TaxID=34880 RepID=A0A811YI93_NYCPR|nr:unnamed protein product [Nyctereutes procyonoides]
MSHYSLALKPNEKNSTFGHLGGSVVDKTFNKAIESIKKDQSEMKSPITEIKNTLEGISTIGQEKEIKGIHTVKK